VANGAVRVAPAQVADLLRDAQDDVHRVPPDDLGPRAVPRIAPLVGRPPAQLLDDATALGAPPQIESELSARLHD
jgi:hypothetical protein